jgi:hypothetical protein
MVEHGVRVLYEVHVDGRYVGVDRHQVVGEVGVGEPAGGRLYLDALQQRVTDAEITPPTIWLRAVLGLTILLASTAVVNRVTCGSPVQRLTRTSQKCAANE